MIYEFLRVIGKDNLHIEEFWEPWYELQQKIMSVAIKEDNPGVIRTLALAGDIEDMSNGKMQTSIA